jgi:hypothetical protein
VKEVADRGGVTMIVAIPSERSSTGSQCLLGVDYVEKPFLGDERNFLGLLIRFARGDVRDHIISRKSSHRSSYRR